MNILKNLFIEKCPKCKDTLVNKPNTLTTQIIKFCPNGHYEKEFHPALESYIEKHLT
ncbi:hypothetical protein NC797_16835 [Aquibacillus sp. 3ASR75-11]|uniref:Uncharacterized protein n=1 Tax=Terrihalobacillus insolitus TaxID=2950438 RepID=A0A9X3WZE2_9BACI|nr:hypothetical protein [Terrihalobacillus insolitus]MDC3414731.1 hypothetical protein [Terrihalobacillus insolitus]MDC3426164.1 hypothetical protein [Terrihalobacillus insolitus]